ncbi:MAG: DUF3298 and DUF4163 domain-containing protein [Clostridiales bacterium]|nr:DUF3298 and DUF4163 domain-containing protein [Clostridiales bacterium]
MVTRWFVLQYAIIKKTVEQQFLYRDTLMVDAAVHFPQLAGPDCEGFQRFNEYYRQRAASLIKYAEETMYPAAVEQYRNAQMNGYPFNHYILLQTFEITCRSSLLSLFADVYEYTGGAHGLTTRTSETWKPDEGRRLSLGDLFVEGYDYMSVIIPVIEAEAARRQASGEADYFDDLPANIRRYFDEENYYLTPAGLVIFYPLYTIAPYASGIQTFTIPYGLLIRNKPPGPPPAMEADTLWQSAQPSVP